MDNVANSEITELDVKWSEEARKIMASASMSSIANEKEDDITTQPSFGVV